jgi:hypothetical protein
LSLVSIKYKNPYWTYWTFVNAHDTLFADPGIAEQFLLFVNAHDTLSLLFQSPTWIYVRVSCSEMGVEEGGIFQIFVPLSESMVAHLFCSFPHRKFHPGGKTIEKNIQKEKSRDQSPQIP